VNADWFKRLFAVVALVGATSAAPSHAGTAHATAGRAATLATFAGTWIGHTRGLTITRSGHAKESIGAGCCDPIVDLYLRLSRPRGSSTNATATVRVTGIRWHDKSGFGNDPPRVGQVGRLALRHGVITDSLTGVPYCDDAADRRGVCGA
jgi:hypothetical protein